MNPTQTQDLYQRLGVSSNATPDEIKHAYRQQAKQWHPDKNPENPQAEAEFKAVAEAYFVLENESRKKRYDATRVVRTEPATHHYKARTESETNPEPFYKSSKDFEEMYAEEFVFWNDLFKKQKKTKTDMINIFKNGALDKYLLFNDDDEKLETKIKKEKKYC